MSYSAEISFKKINPEDVMDFLVSVKHELKNKLLEIAKENRAYIPFARNHIFVERQWSKIPKDEIEASKAWVQDVFKYRYFYNKENGVLGVYGIPKPVQHMFDATVYFQNSCDQNYDKETWEGLDWFENTYNKIMSMSNDEFDEYYEAKHGCRFADHFGSRYLPAEYEYYMKSEVYDEIWSKIEPTLFDDDNVVYFSAFGRYDIDLVQKFMITCHKEMIAFEEENGITAEYLNSKNKDNETENETNAKSSEIHTELDETEKEER